MAPGLQGLPGHPGLDHRPPGRQHHRPQDQEVDERGGWAVSGIHSVFQVSVVHPFHVGASKKITAFHVCQIVNFLFTLIFVPKYCDFVKDYSIYGLSMFKLFSPKHSSEFILLHICQIFIMIKSMDI